MSERATKVLIVDDNAVTVDALETLLRLEGIEADHAANGHAALSRLAIFWPDLILADWFMPGMDGLKFLAQLRQTEGCQEMPVVIMTAADTESLAKITESLVGLGAVRVLRKPFESSELLALLRGLVPPRD